MTISPASTSSVSRLRVPLLTAALSVLAVAATLAVSAEAATLKLRCAGKGPRNADSAGTVICAATGKSRAVAGTVRNDAGQPVAAKLTLTYSSWTPAKNGIGYTITPTSTREITAKADGSFSFSSKTKTRESVRVDVVPDAALGTGAVRAQADVQRRLKTKLKKLGGGKVRVTVKGTKIRPIKVYLLDASGYQLFGTKPKKVSRSGKVTFALGARMGQFAYYVDAGVYDDLFWYLGRPKFKL